MIAVSGRLGYYFRVPRSFASELPLIAVCRQRGTKAGDPIVFQTTQGDIAGRYHSVAGGLATRAVVWLSGSGGGFEGPAHGLYAALALELQIMGIESLRLEYRRSTRQDECVRDALVGAHWLTRERGIERLALVGHAFGSAVAITAGAASEKVSAVAALASPTVEAVARLGKPLFLGHGADDQVQPAADCLRLEQRAAGDVTCRIYPGAQHNLDECRDALSADLVGWLDEQL